MLPLEALLPLAKEPALFCWTMLPAPEGKQTFSAVVMMQSQQIVLTEKMPVLHAWKNVSQSTCQFLGCQLIKSDH